MTKASHRLTRGRVEKGENISTMTGRFQEQSTSCWENLSVLVSQPGESPILFQTGGGDKNFSKEGRFCLTKKRGGEKEKKAHDHRPHTAED